MLLLRYFLFVLLCFFFVQCQKRNNYTVSRVQMANILTDIHIAESATSLLDAEKKDSFTTLYYKQIFEIQGVQEEDFKRNLELLKMDATEMAKVYKLVNDTLEIRKKRVENGR